MPGRRTAKRQGGRSYKRRRTMKRGRARGKSRMYGNKRPKAIQRATNVPKSAMIKFVIDKTFVYQPPAAPAGSDPVKTGVIEISCNNLIQPINTGTSAGTWTVQSGTATDSVEGLTDWVGGAGGRYKKYMVLGAKIDVNSVASTGTGTAGSSYVNNYAIGIHKCTSGDSDITETVQLPAIQKMAYTRLRNATGAAVGAGTGATYQGVRLSDTYSAKKWEGVSDVKDNANLQSTLDSTSPHNPVAPAQGGKFQLFIASREPMSTTKVVPPQLVRVKCEYIALLTEPEAGDNDPMVVN